MSRSENKFTLHNIPQPNGLLW